MGFSFAFLWFFFFLGRTGVCLNCPPSTFRYKNLITKPTTRTPSSASTSGPSCTTLNNTHSHLFLCLMLDWRSLYKIRLFFACLKMTRLVFQSFSRLSVFHMGAYCNYYISNCSVLQGSILPQMIHRHTSLIYLLVCFWSSFVRQMRFFTVVYVLVFVTLLFFI